VTGAGLTGRAVPRWVLWSSSAAPVLLIGGWTAGAARQPGGFDSTVRTISALAAVGAPDRWIMTSALAGVGVCHLVTALGLGPAAVAGRLALAVGGAATVGVAAFPLPGGDGPATAHAIAAGTAFVALAGWPLLSWRRGTAVPALRRGVAVAAGMALLALVGWFAAELLSGGRVGLAERAAAGAQACWPLAVALSARSAVGPRRR
jgi:hypothetical membrane protein